MSATKEQRAREKPESNRHHRFALPVPRRVEDVPCEQKGMSVKMEIVVVGVREKKNFLSRLWLGPECYENEMGTARVGQS